MVRGSLSSRVSLNKNGSGWGKMSHFHLEKDEPWLNLPHGYVISNGSILLNYIGNKSFKKSLSFRINFNANLTCSKTVWPNNAKV